ncbi:MAG TPA: hypothetical protein VIN59_09690 [Alphaproteobacteria bacterium]
MNDDQIKDKAAWQQKQDKRADALRANLKRRKDQSKGNPPSSDQKGG